MNERIEMSKGLLSSVLVRQVRRGGPDDEPPADTPPSDTPPADTPPTDTPPADTPPADTPPADTPPTGVVPSPAPGIVPDDAVHTELTAEAAAEFLGEDFADAEGFIKFVNDQKVVNPKGLKEFLGARAKAAEDALKADETKQLQDWWAEVSGHQTLGRANLEQTKASCAKVLEKLGSPELNEFLVTSGGSVALPVIQFLLKVAPLIPQETGPVPGNPSNQPKDWKDTLYPRAAGG